nr:RNA 2'-phosphotransferase [Burkholderia arboris]
MKVAGAFVPRRYPAVQPPERLYHGTATRFLDSIRAQGLKPGTRHHVHLSCRHPDCAGCRRALRRAGDSRSRCATHAPAGPRVLRRRKRRLANRCRAGRLPYGDRYAGGLNRPPLTTARTSTRSTATAPRKAASNTACPSARNATRESA